MRKLLATWAVLWILTAPTGTWALDAGSPPTDAGEATPTASPSAGDVSTDSSADDPEGAPRREGDTGPSPRNRLLSDFDLDPQTLDSSEKLSNRLETAETRLDQLEASVEKLERRLVRERARRQGVREHVARLEDEPPIQLLVGLASDSVRVADLRAERTATRHRVDRRQREIELLEGRQTNLERRLGATLREAARNQAERARDAEREALRALRRAKKRESRERNQKLKELLVRQRELAEKRLALTKRHNERLPKVRAETRRQRESFATRKAEFLSAVQGLPDSPTLQEQKEKVDPTFEDLLELRNDLKRRYFEGLDSASEARDRVDRAQSALQEAEASLEELRARRGPLAESELWKRRIETAKARVELRRQELEAAIDVRDAYRARMRDLRERLYFTADTLRTLLPEISDASYGEHFAVFDEANWEHAFESLRWRSHALYDHARDRAEQTGQLSERLVSLSTWGWLGGLLWRALILVVLVRFLFPAVPEFAERTMERLLRRPFFQLRPAATVKFVEVSASVVRYGLLYLGVVFLGNYVTATITELEVFLWVIDAGILYWFALDVVSILVVPHRERNEERPRRERDLELRRTALEEARAAADLAGLEPERAEKFTRSTSVVVGFWLLAAYLPDFAIKLTGPTVLWYAIHWAATWGFVAVVYWVLSAWRDEIASIFERLAGDPMSRAVAFVNNHKDRPWGVLVIAVASIYVLGKQCVRVVRTYLLETDWFRKLSNFALRKSIELKRSGDRRPDSADSADDLPADYRQRFRDHPLDGTAEHRVERKAQRDAVHACFERWQSDGRQGSVALVGESGMGRTTLLQTLADRIRDAAETPPVVGRGVEQRHATTTEVLTWIADLLEIDGTFATSEELVDRIEQLDPHVVIVDDCQHLFLKQTGGFEGLEALLEVVTLTDTHHFWCLSFNNFAWSYINRIRERSHNFGRVVELPRWAESEIREMIERRNAASNYRVHFGEIDQSHREQPRSERFADVEVSANGFYRYLRNFSAGNPRVAALYWLRSLRFDEEDRRIDVRLFQRPPTEELLEMNDDYWFVLAAIAQHGWIGASALAESTNIDEGFCALALDYFEETGVVDVDSATGRARLSPLYLRQVLEHLSNSNLLYG